MPISLWSGSHKPAVGSGARVFDAMKLLICFFLTRPRKRFSACSCSTKKQLKRQNKPSGHFFCIYIINMYFYQKKKRINFKYKSFKYINSVCCRNCTDIYGCPSCENYDKGLHSSNSYYSEDESDEAEGDEQEASLTV